MSGAQVLAAYKYQPNLEKRHAHLKGTQHVAPMFLRDPARIEALLCCHFIAMLIQALLERQIRAAMATAGLVELSLYPEDRGCAAPTATRVLEIFQPLARHHLYVPDGAHVQTFPPELTDLQRQVLKLLDIPQPPTQPPDPRRDGGPKADPEVRNAGSTTAKLHFRASSRASCGIGLRTALAGLPTSARNAASKMSAPTPRQRGQRTSLARRQPTSRLALLRCFATRYLTSPKPESQSNCTPGPVASTASS